MNAICTDAAALGHRFLNAHAATDFHAFQHLLHPVVSAQPYVDARHLRGIACALQAVAEGKTRRLLIAVAPRHFKSYQASVALPAFLLGLNPSAKVICASYGSELADTFARQSRQILMSPRYAAIFPSTKLRSTNPPQHDQRTTQGGYRFTTSIGGTLTGLGADVVILDDPLKATDAASQSARDTAYEWLKEGAMTRFDDPARGAVIVVMQRLHQDDVIGRLKAEGGWTVLELPAEAPTPLTFATGRGRSVSLKPGDILFPERFSEEILAERRRELGEAAYAAQYLQRPTPPGGHLFKLKHCPRFDLSANRRVDQYEGVVLSLDPGVSTAPTADFTALTIWGVRGDGLFLLHAARGRWDFATQLATLRKYRERVQALLIERSHAGIMLIDQLVRESGSDAKLIGFTPRLEKTVRAEYAAGFMEKRRIHLPEAAPWLEAFELELASFPHTANDDQVDSVSQFIFVLLHGFPHWLRLSNYPMAGRAKVTVL
jgi:predicted phage terminase large subunit-like protein